MKENLEKVSDKAWLPPGSLVHVGQVKDGPIHVFTMDYDPENWEATLNKAFEFGDKIPLGLLYRKEKPLFESHFPVLTQGPLCHQGVDNMAFKQVLASYR